MTVSWWCSGSWEEGTRQIVESQPWTSGKQTLDYSENCFKGSHGIQSWREGSRRLGWYSRIHSKLKSSPSRWAGGQAKAVGGLHEWTGCSWTQGLNLCRKVYKRWKQGQVTQEEYGNVVWAYTNVVRKARAQTELNLVRDMSSNKKDFYTYSSSKRKTYLCWRKIRLGSI